MPLERHDIQTINNKLESPGHNDHDGKVSINLNRNGKMLWATYDINQN